MWTLFEPYHRRFEMGMFLVPRVFDMIGAWAKTRKIARPFPLMAVLYRCLLLESDFWSLYGRLDVFLPPTPERKNSQS